MGSIQKVLQNFKIGPKIQDEIWDILFVTVAVKSFGFLQSTTYRKLSIKAKSTLQVYNLSTHIITTIIVLKPSDIIELSSSYLPCYNNIKVLLKVVDKFRC